LDINILGKRINYEIYGEGEPVIFLNGMLMSARSYSYFAPKLAKHMKVILLDLPDQGNSEPFTEQHNINDYMDYIKAFMDELKIESASLLGVSYGGAVAMLFALKYPHMVKSLALYNTFPLIDPYIRSMSMVWKSAFELGDEVEMKRVAYPLFYSRTFYEENFKRLKHIIEKKTKNLPGHYFESLLRLIYSSEGYDIVDRLKEIKCPSLVISSDEDVVAPRYYQELIVNEIENSVLVTFEGTGHAAIFEKPDLFVASLIGHILTSL